MREREDETQRKTLFPCSSSRILKAFSHDTPVWHKNKGCDNEPHTFSFVNGNEDAPSQGLLGEDGVFACRAGFVCTSQRIVIVSSAPCMTVLQQSIVPHVVASEIYLVVLADIVRAAIRVSSIGEIVVKVI